jgi:cell division protein FtsZ
VVATGLRSPAEQSGPRAVVFDNQPPRRVGGDIDYGRLDQPTVNRRSAPTTNSGEATARKLDAQLDTETDYLDVPAFLRKQAD